MNNAFQNHVCSRVVILYQDDASWSLGILNLHSIQSTQAQFHGECSHSRRLEFSSKAAKGHFIFCNLLACTMGTCNWPFHM